MFSDAITIVASFSGKLFSLRRLIINFIRRDLATRYFGSFLGILWAVLHPLVLLVSYTFIFSILFRSGVTEGRSSEPFVLFLFAGLLPWLYFQDTVQRSSTALVENSNLIRRTVFPSEILPVVVAGSNVVTPLIGFGLFLVVLYIFHGLTLHLFIIPLLWVLMIAWALGFAWLMAALTVFFRDISQILIVALILWFWFTPIFYSLEQVEHRLPIISFFLKINPMTYIVLGYQDLLINHRWPELWMLVALTGFSASSLILGGVVFRVLKRDFVDAL